MTLLELLVVLIILAIMATIAVQSIQPRVDNARFDATRKTMDVIVRAIIGTRDSRQSDGTPILDGFIADIGRLPRPSLNLVEPAPASPAPLETSGSLNELWNPESDLARNFSHQFRAGPKVPADFSDIRLACGWQGPYLHLPIGARELADGWGRPFRLELNDQGNIRGIAADLPPALFEQPLTTEIVGGRVSVSGTVSGDITSGAPVNVYLLTPDPSRSLEELSVLEDEDEERLFFRFSGVSIGLRALVVESGSTRIVKYLQVPHQGLNLSIQIQTRSEEPTEVRADQDSP